MSDRQPVVYIVDDDPSVRKSLHRLLTIAGFQSITFSSALEYLQADHSYNGPSCLILDVRLPGLDGLELQKVLAGNKTAPPIIFITGHGDIPMSVRAMKAGATDFLSKPFSDEVLLDAVAQGLEKSRRENARMTDMAKIHSQLDLLTPREKEVLGYVARGWLNKHIADKMGISEKTVKVHRGRVMQKLQARSVAELVRLLEKIERSG
jgi:FixJ family two-component response regulator